MKQRQLESLVYSTVGVVGMFIILLAFNVVSGAFKQRVDLTAEKAYTLSAGTRAILGKLDTRVTIRFYCTQGENAMPVYLKSFASHVDDLLGEYKQVARGRIVVEKFDPQPDSDAEDAAKLHGIEGQMMSNGDMLYMGLVISMLEQSVAIPFLAPEREKLIEYDLTRAISRVMTPEKPVIGVMTPLPVFGMPMNPMMARMGQQPGGQEPWTFVSELQRDYTVKQIGLEVDQIDDDVKLLVVIHPKDITDKAQFAIDQFVLRGGKLVAFLDAMCVSDTRNQSNPMMGQMPGGGSTMEKLLKAWGFQFDTTKVVADMVFKLQTVRNNREVDLPAALGLNARGINTNDVATYQIDNIWLPFTGALTGVPADGLKQTVLLKSSVESQLVEGFMAQMAPDNIVKEFKASGTSYTLATRLTGKFKTAFPDGAPEEKKDADPADKDKPIEPKKTDSLKESKTDGVVVLFGDSDLLNDPYTVSFQNTPFGRIARYMNANLSLAQNIIEQLSGDSNLINLRSRATLARPFTVVRDMEERARKSYQDKIKSLEDSLADTERQLSELQTKKEGKQKFVMSPEQQQAIDNFRKKQAEAKKELKDLRKQLRRDSDSLEFWTKILNIALMPLAVALTGVVLAMVKRKKTAAK